MALAAINVKKPREAQIWKCSTGNLVLRILPDSNNFWNITEQTTWSDGNHASARLKERKNVTYLSNMA